MAEPGADNVPEAVAAPLTRRVRGLSIVWIVPLVAAIAGGWLAWTAYQELGPIVTITFDSAEGLEEGRTTIRHKDVDVGTVESITLSEDLASVIVRARMARQLEDYLTERTRFWVVRARVSPGGVSGLTTLFSGAYIAIDPSPAGAREREFTGLDEPPAIAGDQPGRYYALHAPTLGQADLGSPVYYRGIRVGEVVDYQLAPGGESVTVRIFVRKPYADFVRRNTHFWNAGGLDVSLGVEGVSVESPSLVSMLVGGIAFDTPPSLRPGEVAKDGADFPLFPSRSEIEDDGQALKQYFLVYFEQSVRGLSRGAPVELRGIRVGEVADIRLQYDAEALSFRVPVLLEVQADRIEGVGDLAASPQEYFGMLVEEGLRAQLKQASLLTGQLLVNLDVFPDAPAATLAAEGDYLVIPTRPGELEELTSALTGLAARLESVPFDEIGRNLNQAAQGVNELVSSDEMRRSVASLAQTLESVQSLAAQMNSEVAPAVSSALEHVGRVLANAEHLLSPDEPVHRELRRVMRDMSEAARSLRVMADYLERHPEALIYGREDEP